MDPLISVLTVCRNAEHEIGATIRSLVDQDSDCHEWVVIDGSSSDGTLACIAKSGIASRRVTSEPDHGIFDAMNKAVTMARGKWVYFLNAGDELADPRVLRDVATALAGGAAPDLLWGDMLYQEPGGHRRLRRFAHVGVRMLHFEDLNHQAVFARRALFDRVGLFSRDWPTSADYDWLLRAMRSGATTLYLPRVIGVFATGGSHAKNPIALQSERTAIRRQYLSRSHLAAGLWLARWRRRLRIIAGHGG